MLVYLLTTVLVISVTNVSGRNIKIHKIEVMGLGTTLTCTTSIHSNRTAFDMFFVVNEQVMTHDLALTMKLKLKQRNQNNYVTLYQWKKLDLCDFLTSYDKDEKFQHHFRYDKKKSSMMACPIRKGNYTLLNFRTTFNIPEDVMPNGLYRLYLEVCNLSAEFVKMLSMRITVIVNEIGMEGSNGAK